MGKTTNERLLKKNYQFFLNELSELLKDDSKRNKVALIKDEQIIGFYDDVQTAVQMAKKNKFEWETFLVQKIEKQGPHYISRIITQ